jgi:ribosomal protein L40E
VLILFSNDGDTALKDVILNDIIPEKFEIKDWLIRGNSDKRDDCEMNTEAGEGGTHITWTIPIVEKGERLEVSFEILGPGVIDGEAGNRFHGVHFGDEVETEDIASPVEEEAVEEEAAEEEAETNVSWREDVLLRVMAAADIDVELRDEFVKHAVNFDSDNNGYLKKAELQAAADAWNAEAEETVEEVAEEEVAAEESVEEAATEEEVATEEASSEDAEAEEKACPTCNAMCAADATSCSVCFYTF